MDNNSWNCNKNQELDIEKNSSQEENNSSQNLLLNLKRIEDEKINKNDDEDSLSYSTLYRSSQSSFNKNSKDIELSIKRKVSNISNSQSDFNYQDFNGFSSEKIYMSKKSFNGIQPNNLFGNESTLSIFNYFQETEEYFRNLDLTKSDYKKTKNYIEKDIYYQDYLDQRDDSNEYFKYKTTDYIEENKNSIIEGNSNININISMSKDNTIENNEEKSSNEINKKDNNINEEVNNKTNSNKKINNNIIFNSNYINQIYINPNINFNSINGGKYDYAMCCLGYYSVDCKSYNKFNSYFFSYII